MKKRIKKYLAYLCMKRKQLSMMNFFQERVQMIRRLGERPKIITIDNKYNAYQQLKIGANITMEACYRITS